MFKSFKTFTFLTTCILLLFTTSAYSTPQQQLNFDDFNEEGLNQGVAVKVSGDSLKWEIFAKTKENMECTIDKEGFDNCLIKPIYSPEIKALNNKEVTLTGFMFPLEASEKQKNFLIGPYPASCPFNYHVSPSQIVEVKTNKAIEFSYDPITVKGILSLKYNEETGVFYYLIQK